MNIVKSTKFKTFAPDHEVKELMQQVQEHPVFSALDDKHALSVFMRHHVFAVWDFMSLVKSVQSFVAPCTIPWVPSTENSVVKAINEIVLSEESDVDMSGTGSCSHFDLYLDAMKELKISVDHITDFIEIVRRQGVTKAVEKLPKNPSTQFVNRTFDTISAQNPLVIACWFAYGREKIIPGMFSSVLNRLGISRQQAPHFYYYLERHTELDGGEHSHFAQQLVDHFCERDEKQIDVAQDACKEAIKARITFWDGVLKVIEQSRQSTQNRMIA
ncbi:MAG: DUF3050 domain-containing protein [bacterium]|nr:DUF3050 domain-containing protein [bacterium]|tara:strand:- start:295 stop:1110 length:816 start_codon:yes stop_codon:yes gene_type:complete